MYIILWVYIWVAAYSSAELAGSPVSGKKFQYFFFQKMAMQALYYFLIVTFLWLSLPSTV